MVFSDGQFIKAKELEQWISDILINIRSKISTLIPKGSLISYSLNGLKTFSYKPFLNLISYDTKPNDTPLSSSSNVYALGSGWNLNLATALGVQQKASFTGLTDTYQTGFIFPYNPLTFEANGIPLKGNSPLVYNGFLGFSSNVQDTNIRLTVNTAGTILSLDALKISTIIRWTTSSNFQITTDSMPEESDRRALGLRHLNNLNLTVSSTTIFNGAVSGFSPSKVNGNNYAVWLLDSLSTGTKLLALTKWDAGFPTIDGIVNNIYTSSTPAYYNTTIGTTFPYIRCVGCVYVNSDGLFEYSKSKIWGQEEGVSLNGDPLYTELYQQDSETNTTIRNATSSLDRRVIPSYYYLDQKNINEQNLVNFKGLIRDIPNSGSNQLFFWSDGDKHSLKINTLELSNGTSSLFMCNVDKIFSTAEVITDWSPYKLTFTTSTPFYWWIAANPYSVLDQNMLGLDASTTQSTYMTKSNLQWKLFCSTSSSWTNIGTTFKTNNLKGFEWRCRIGWGQYLDSITNGLVGVLHPFTQKDNEISMIRPTQISFNTISSNYSNYVPVSQNTVSTNITNIWKYVPTVNSNSTVSTATTIEGRVIHYNTISTTSAPNPAFRVVSSDNLINTVNDIQVFGLSSTYQTTSTYESKFYVPLPYTTSSIQYYFNSAYSTNSSGLIFFTKFNLPMGSF